MNIYDKVKSEVIREIHSKENEQESLNEKQLQIAHQYSRILRKAGFDCSVIMDGCCIDVIVRMPNDSQSKQELHANVRVFWANATSENPKHKVQFLEARKLRHGYNKGWEDITIRDVVKRATEDLRSVIRHNEWKSKQFGRR